MGNRKMVKRASLYLLIFTLVLSAVSWPAASPVSAAADYTDIFIPNGGGKIINRGDTTSLTNSVRLDEANSFGIFAGKAPGTTVERDGVKSDSPAHVELGLVGSTYVGKINVASNPTLKRLAEGGQARFFLRLGKVEKTNGTVNVKVNNASKYSSDIYDERNVNSGWITFGPNDVIEINFFSTFLGILINDIELYFADITLPTYTGNTFTHNGTVRFNNDPAVNKNELFLKQGNYLNIALNFSEPVFPVNAVDASDRVNNQFSFMRTELFSNPGGDGFEPSVYYLTSNDPGYGAFNVNGLTINGHSRNSFNLRYTASQNDSTGNIPLDPLRLTLPVEEDRPTLLERFNSAGFIDGAGNPLANIGSIGTVPFADNANPGGTFRTIIDARPPQYSASRNGVQPQILTGLVLNEGDEVDFSVYLNEKVVSAISPTENTQIKFTNGLTARYISGENTSEWTFRLTVPAGVQAETMLLETAALEHVSSPGDGKALRDYAGNLLTEAVKPIGWANLSVDNTAPLVNFVYRDQDGEIVPDGQYVGSGSIAINAYDPDINGQSSKGLFRPGSGSGLVYYLLNQSPDDPFAGLNDNFAAVKRYSLSQKQPSEELYPTGFEDVVLTAAQNGVIVDLPGDASQQNGIWYLHTWTADMSWDSARQRMQYDKGSAERAAYEAANPNATPADLETYFRSSILPNLSDYSNVAQWPLSDFGQKDSNWSYHVGVLKIDNDDPEVEAIGVADNNSDNVKVTVKATDPTSEIKDGKIQYQFVKAGEQPVDSGWLEAALNAQDEASIFTLNNPVITKGGKYDLYAKATDVAGNSSLSAPQEVDALVITTLFQSYPGTYAINDGPDFTIAGVPIDNVEYLYSQSSERPAAGSEWHAIADEPVTATLAGEAALRYGLPADQTLNGTWYAHVRVKQKDINRYYYYYKEYQFDHLPPSLTFGSQSYLYPMPEQTVQIAVTDTLVDFAGVASENILYQWIKVTDGQAEQELDLTGQGWKIAPDDRVIKLAVDDKNDNGNYRLYVYAKDSLGNGKLYKTNGLFSVFYLSDEPPVGSAVLISVSNAGNGDYTAILKLAVDVPAQEGYFYSVSDNDGDNWSTWLPFTNYVGVPVDSNDPNALKDRLRVKFKGFYGNVSDIVTPETAIQNAPAYALASLEQIIPIRGGAKVEDGGKNEGQTIVFDLTNGKTVVPTDSNPELPETLQPNKQFKIYRNGSYSFLVTDGGKSAVVHIVVSNFDDTEPIVNVKYSTIAPTNGKVTASLQSSKPLRITNLTTQTKQFTENGEFIFEYEDAVGFTGAITATVENIDKTPPEADIVLHYNHPDLKALIRHQDEVVVVDSSGDGYNRNGEFTRFAVPTLENVIASNLIVAQVRPKQGQTQDYQVVSNNAGGNQSAITLSSNGKARFTIVDAAGNQTVVQSDPIATLAGQVPDIEEITMTRVAEDGRELTEDELVEIGGKLYSKGQIRVSLTMKSSAVAENTVMIGEKPAAAFSIDYAGNGERTLLLSDLLGNTRKAAFTVSGLDNAAPVIKLNNASAAIMQNKAGFNPEADLGGYTLSDNLSAAEDIEVTIAELVLEGGQYVDKPFDLSKPGRHTVRYTATDQLGNKGYAVQSVFVRAADGMFVTANGIPLSDTESETAILNTSNVTFDVVHFQNVLSGSGQKLINELGTYDIYYFQGLAREGQMKYIATKVTYEELVKGEFKVKLPKAGWYTIVVQNQERERIYATLLVSRTD
ncbi:hypothetical protein ACX93W_26070 [Paenibacillus sp. CAU 1782]